MSEVLPEVEERLEEEYEEMDAEPDDSIAVLFITSNLIDVKERIDEEYEQIDADCRAW